jgi:hypothetical protein
MKQFVFVVLLLSIAASVYSLEDNMQDNEDIVHEETNSKKIAVAAGIEWNMNLSKNFASGVVEFPRFFHLHYLPETPKL